MPCCQDTAKIKVLLHHIHITTVSWSLICQGRSWCFSNYSLRLSQFNGQGLSNGICHMAQIGCYTSESNEAMVTYHQGTDPYPLKLSLGNTAPEGLICVLFGHLQWFAVTCHIRDYRRKTI